MFNWSTFLSSILVVLFRDTPIGYLCLVYADSQIAKIVKNSQIWLSLAIWLSTCVQCQSLKASESCRYQQNPTNAMCLSQKALSNVSRPASKSCRYQQNATNAMCVSPEARPVH